MGHIAPNYHCACWKKDSISLYATIKSVEWWTWRTPSRSPWITVYYLRHITPGPREFAYVWESSTFQKFFDRRAMDWLLQSGFVPLQSKRNYGRYKVLSQNTIEGHFFATQTNGGHVGRLESSCNRGSSQRRPPGCCWLHIEDLSPPALHNRKCWCHFDARSWLSSQTRF